MSSKRKKPGPKPKIGPEEEKQIHAVLAMGGSLNDAADYLGIARSTLNDRMASDEEFRKGVDRSTAQGKIRLIQKVGKADAWQAAAWMLERKWGTEFGRKVDVTSGGDAIKILVEYADPCPKSD